MNTASERDLLSPRRARTLFAACSCIVLLAACAADSSNRLDEADADETGEGGSDVRERPGADVVPGDTDPDAPETPDGSGGGGGGGFLAPCTTDGECDSGYCVPYEGERVCTQYCFDGNCPEDFECRFLSGTGADTVRLCVPARETLCSPCDSDLDCGGFGDLCVRVGDSGFCARDCEAERLCPEGYLCDPATSIEGATGRQCLPSNGRCSCPPDQFGESRPCVRANAQGICEGVEVCEPDLGWSRCSAPSPVGEVCDGIDNDCDNLIDEGMDARPCSSTPNPLGSCPGTERCTGAGGWVCDAPPAAVEVCDGLDNDCNGVIDDGLCFDGNPCTRDLCDAATGGCNYVPFSGPCDDGNVCTTGEICMDGVCRGTPLNCDDGNACTSDSCVPTTGCVNTVVDGAPCETGNFCTSDTCRSGVCAPGPAVSCGTPDVCLAPSCDPAIGCTTQRLTGGACDDDDGCTVGDRCSNGTCVGGTPYCQGRSCSNCSGSWNIALGGTCIDTGFLGPQCICICF